jgi:hypothetical protein
VIIFRKTLFVPNEMLFDNHYCGTPGTCPPPGVQSQVINVNFWATGKINPNTNQDVATLLFGCFINGIPCHSGSSGATALLSNSNSGIPGWVSLLVVYAHRQGKGQFGLHYNWCIPRTRFFLDGDAGGGYNQIVIKAAYRENTTTPGKGVIQAAQVKIDTATIESTELDGVTVDACRASNGL